MIHMLYRILYLYVGTYNGMEYLKGWSDPCVTSMQLFCALCLPRLLVPPLLYWFPVCVYFFFFLLVNYAHTQWVLNVLHPIIFGAGSVSWGVAQWHYISSFSKLFLCCLLLDTCVLGWNPLSTCLDTAYFAKNWKLKTENTITK